MDVLLPILDNTANQVHSLFPEGRLLQRLKPAPLFRHNGVSLLLDRVAILIIYHLAVVNVFHLGHLFAKYVIAIAQIAKLSQSVRSTLYVR